MKIVIIIFIESSDNYIKVPAIAGVRPDSGMIQMDYTNKVLFNEILDLPSYDYYIGVQFHSYYTSTTFFLFWLPIKTKVSTTLGK